MAITVRYGQDPALLDAAVVAGQGQNRDRRFSQEQQLVSQVRDYQLNQDRLRLESNKLQIAGNLRRRMTGSPIPGDARRAGPLAQDISGRTPFGLNDQSLLDLQAAKTFGGQGMSGQLLSQLAPDQFGQQGPTPGVNAKRAFLDTMLQSGAIDESQLQGLLAIADSPDTDLADVRQVMSSVQSDSRQDKQNQQFQTTLERQNLDSQRRSLEQQIRTVTGDLTKDGFDPAVKSIADLQPQVREPGGFIGENFRALGDKFLPGQPFTDIVPQGTADKAKAAALAKRTQLVRLQARLNDINQQRSALSQPRTQVPGTSDTRAPASPAPGYIDEGFRFRGGDPADPKNWEAI